MQRVVGVEIDRLAVRNRPNEPPVMYQSWQRLLFLHWRIDPAVIQKRLPLGLTVDTFDGSAWIGVVPFYMRNIRPCWSPVVPYVSNFLELNLRTYAVNDAGVPGVWFFSLDASRLLAVGVARSWFRLPYHWSAMSANVQSDGCVDYRSRRWFSSTNLSTSYRYRPRGDVFHAQPGTLEFFLAERYILFADLGQNRIATGQVHHVPYPLQHADVDRHDDHLLQLQGFAPPARPFDHACYSAGVDVEVYGLKSPR